MSNAKKVPHKPAARAIPRVRDLAEPGGAGVPEGWKLVPVKMTKAMNRAGVNAASEFYHSRADAVDAVYVAAIAAAPTQQEGGKE